MVTTLDFGLEIKRAAGTRRFALGPVRRGSWDAQNCVRNALKKEARMTTATSTIEELANQEYKYGFVSEIEADTAPRGLSEDIIRLISAKKNEPDFMLEWRLKAYRNWLTMQEPEWPNVTYPPIDYQDIFYYSAPKSSGDATNPEEIDPELVATYEKLGIPLAERNLLMGVKAVAVDYVFDSVSVITTFKEELAKHGIIFCSKPS